MALFKIFKGKSNNLGITGGTNKIKDGYAYFTPDDGKFYIDVGTDGDAPILGNSSQDVVDGKQVNRICINHRIFNYNDYDILDCGQAFEEDVPTIIFNCGSSAE